jgi:hypothetical protein
MATHLKSSREGEDKLLNKYWKTTDGRLYVEIPIGGQGGQPPWPEGTERRRIDGVLFPDLPPNPTFPSVLSRQSFRDNLTKSDHEKIEIIEVKRHLDRLVIGQVLVAQDMFERQYGFRPTKLTIVCEAADPGQQWVCTEKRGIKVWVAPSSASS